jgi:hypothetical protein
MFGSGILEVAIGMAFVYLLLSLVCTAVSEWVAALFSLRATNLEAGIRSLFSEGKLTKDGPDISQALYNHGLIKSMYRQDWFDNLLHREGRPSYIPSRTFALALFDVLAPADEHGSRSVKEVLEAVRLIPNAAARQSLTTVINQGEGKVEDARKAVEEWFNNGMDRVAGWYKRKSQVILLILAAVLAIGTNTDSVLVAKTLWNTPALRDATSKAAEQFVQTHKDNPATQSQVTPQQAAENVRTFHSALEELGLPIGWPTRSPEASLTTNASQAFDPRSLPADLTWRNFWCMQLFWTRLLGWTLTAVAVSFGAPFWFDTLNKFMVVRSTVKPREKSRDEASKDAK